MIDNASTDDTCERVHRFATQHRLQDRLYCHRNPKNVGFTAALNQAISRASAPFVLILNPDTVLPPNALPSLTSILEQHPEVGALAPQLRYTDGRIQPSCRRFPRHRDVYFSIFGLDRLFLRSGFFNRWKMGDFDHDQIRDVEQPQGACLLTRRDVITTIGLWDERYPMFFSDVDWCRRVWAAGYRILFTPEVVVMHHRGKSVRAERPAMILSSHRSFIRYFWLSYPGLRWLPANFGITLLLIATGLLRYAWAHAVSTFSPAKMRSLR